MLFLKSCVDFLSQIAHVYGADVAVAVGEYFFENGLLRNCAVSVFVKQKEKLLFLWCEIYAITEGAIIPVITGMEKTINYSAKTMREMKNNQKKKEGAANE